MKMGMTGWLLISVIALGGYIALVERRGDTSDQRRNEARRALKFSPEAVRALRIESTNGVISCRLENGTWMLTEPVRAPANVAEIQRILFGLESLPKGETITAADQTSRGLDRADYGLQPPRAIISLEGEGIRLRLHVGRTTPLGTLYVRPDPQDTILSTSTNLLALLPSSPAQWRDRSLLRADPEQVRRIHIRRPDGFLQLVREESGEWTLQQPVPASADRAAVEAWISSLLSIRVSDFVRDQVTDISPYGYDNPAAMELTLDLDRAEAPSLTVRLGSATDTNNEYCFALRKPEGAVVSVPVALRDLLSVKVATLRDRRLLHFDVSEVKGFTLQRGGQSVTLEKQADQWKITSPAQNDADPEIVRRFLAEWQSARAEDYLNPSTPDEVTGLNTPYATLTFRRTPTSTVSNTAPVGATTTNALIDPSVLPDKNALMLRIGARPVTNGWWAAQWGGEPPVLLRPPMPSLLSPNPLLYRSREVLRIDPNTVRSLTLAKDGAEQRVERSGPAEWRPPAGENTAVDIVGVRLRISELCRLQALGLISEQTTPDASYGMDHPSATLTITLAGDQGMSKTLIIGNSTEAGVYAMIRGQNLVFMLDAALASRLKDDLYVRPAPSANTSPPPGVSPSRNHEPAAPPAR